MFLKPVKSWGVSRGTFYRYQELVAEGGIDAMINRPKRTSNVLQT